MDSTRSMPIPGALDAAQAIPLLVKEFDVPSRPSQVSRIRDRVRKVARSLPFTPDQLDDICIAVGEAATNAVKHGHNPLVPRVTVGIEKYTDSLRVFITDRGPGFDASAICPSNALDLCERGRGILCMRCLMDEVLFYRLDDGMCVQMTKRVTRDQ